MTLPQVTDEVLSVLKEIEPDVDFFAADAVDAACDIYDVIGDEDCSVEQCGDCPTEEHGGES